MKAKTLSVLSKNINCKLGIVLKEISIICSELHFHRCMKNGFILVKHLMFRKKIISIIH